MAYASSRPPVWRCPRRWRSPAPRTPRPTRAAPTRCNRRDGYVTVGGQTAASVKQYKGCGKNYAYTYVWQQYRASHGSYQVCTSIVTGSTLRDLQCSSGPDVWSSGANTLSVCTRALGGISDVAQKETEVRC